MAQQELANAILKSCEDVSQVLKSISHPVRLKILCQLIDGEKSVGELTDFCKISQSAMSQFLGRMKDDAALESRRDGHHIFYAIADRKLLRLLKSIKDIYC